MHHEPERQGRKDAAHGTRDACESEKRCRIHAKVNFACAATTVTTTTTLFLQKTACAAIVAAAVRGSICCTTTNGNRLRSIGGNQVAHHG